MTAQVPRLSTTNLRVTMGLTPGLRSVFARLIALSSSLFDFYVFYPFQRVKILPFLVYRVGTHCDI